MFQLHFSPEKDREACRIGRLEGRILKGFEYHIPSTILGKNYLYMEIMPSTLKG
jgi:hypothetical protein